MLTFSHPGKIGDLLYSLHYCVDRTKAAGYTCFAFNIQTGRTQAQINSKWDNPGVLLTEQDAQFVKPLLEAQPYVANVTINGGETGIDLGTYMCCGLNPLGGDLRDFYYQLDSGIYKRNFWEPLIYADRDAAYMHHKDHIIIGRTGRYDNALINWKALEPYADRIIFLGTNEEYERFKAHCFELSGMIPSAADSLLDCARLMVTCKGYVGGPSGLYALAEMMKIPRILITPDWIVPPEVQTKDGKLQAIPGPKNVLPIGGTCATANRTERLIACIENLLQ